MTQAVGEVLEYGVDGVSGLLARGPQVLLQSSRHGREDGLGGLVRVHRDGGRLVVMQPLDVGKGLLGGSDQAGAPLLDAPLVLVLLVEALVVTGVAATRMSR